MKRFSIALALAVAAGCSPTDALPSCSTGRGTDGSTSVLRLVRNGEKVSGTYDVTTPDAPADTALRYVIEGTAKDGRLKSNWAVGSTVVKVTGRYTEQEITLDNPTGEFSTTHFTAGCSSSAQPTSTTVLGRDPTAPTTATTSRADNPTFVKLVSDLKRHGFKVRVGKSERDPLVPRMRLWEVTINGIGGYIAVCETDDALTTKLELLNNFGSIAVFSTTARWIINPESAMTDDATFANSEKLANALGKALYNDWQGSVRLSVP